MNPAASMTPIRRFLNLLQVDRQEIISVYIYALFNGIVSLSLPLGIQAIINLLSVGQMSTSWVILVIFVIVGVAFTGVMQIMQLVVTESIQQKIFTRSAFEFAFRIPRLRAESVERAYLPEMVNRFFDTLSLQKGLSKILMDFSSASLQIVFGLLLLSFYHPFFILFGLSLVIIIYLIFRYSAPHGLRTSLEESRHKYEVAHWLEELGRTMESFKLAGKSPLPLKKTDELVSDYLGARKKHFKTLMVQYINLVGFKVLVAAGLLLIGGLLVINQQMNIGQFVAAEIVIILVLASVEKLIVSMETIYDILTSIEKIGNFTDIPLEKSGGPAYEMEVEGGLSLNLHDVHYSFPGSKESLINGLNINIPAGSKICISGPNGSGKSFLLQLLAGLYSEYKGSIAYNGIPLDNWNRENLRELIGDSLAREEIFRGTLLENITMGKEGISLDDVRDIVGLLGLQSFVESQPDGYETELKPEGLGIPSSVKLKIMLARCIIGKPRLILLEDSINQLNGQIRERVLDYLLKLDCTVVAVSNNKETADKFDSVFVLTAGKVIAEGKLSTMNRKPWFKEIFH